MPKEHIVKSFDSELDNIETIIAEMGGVAEQQLAKAIEALLRRDADLARQVIADDVLLDRMERDLDTQAMTLLALRQPMAEDLRAVIAGLKTASNLERIGDYAKNVAKRSITLMQSDPVDGAPRTISRMADLVRAMISNVLDAYMERDSDKAADVRARDQEVDQLHTSLFRELLTYMMEDPGNIMPCTHLLFIAKNIERMGDHATNIAEYVHFIAHGDIPQDERPKDDQTSQTMVDPGVDI
jgi:phosphate transport system protein